MEKHLNNLTGLRFGAALLILGYHSSWSGSSKVVETFFSAGYVGVSFFFVLSGFIIIIASVMIFNLVERKIHKKLKALIMSRQ